MNQSIHISFYKISDLFYTLVCLHNKQEKIQKWVQALHFLQLYFTSSTYSSSFSCLSKLCPSLKSITCAPSATNLTISLDQALTIQTVVPSSRLFEVVPPSYQEPMRASRGIVAPTQCMACISAEEISTKQPARSVSGPQPDKLLKTAPIKKKLLHSTRNVWFRVSDYSFFGLLEGPTATIYSPINFSITSSFGQTFSRKMEKLILRAATMSLSPKPYYVLDRERVTEFGSSYRFDSVVQCSPDLDPTNCTVCLRSAVQKLMGCCSRSREAHIFLPKCLLKYDTTSNLPVNVPSLGAIKGNMIFGRIFIAVMTASMLACLGL